MSRVRLEFDEIGGGSSVPYIARDKDGAYATVNDLPSSFSIGTEGGGQWADIPSGIRTMTVVSENVKLNGFAIDKSGTVTSLLTSSTGSTFTKTFTFTDDLVSFFIFEDEQAGSRYITVTLL